MQDPHQRIVNLKLAFFAFAVAVAGVALMVLNKYLVATGTTEIITFVPISEVGGTLLVAGIVGIGLDLWISGDRGAVIEKLVEKVMIRVMAKLAPTLRDSVIQAFADNIDNLSVIATDDFLDQLTRNALTLRLGDKDFATDIYEDIRDQAISATERWHDTKISMNLSPLSMDNTSTERVPLFVLTTRYEYTVVPSSPIRRFTAVSDDRTYRELVEDPSETSIWYVNPATGLDGGSREAFELVQFAVDGDEQKIRRSTRSGVQSYAVKIGSDIVDAAKPVNISYTYRTVLRQHGHMLHVDVEQPSKGLDVELEYGDCGIDEMRLIPFIASSKKVRSYRLPRTVPEMTVGIGFDGWVMPKQGVIAVWVSEADSNRAEKHPAVE
ncbi:hypothetical protein [Rhodococcus sp. IEGM 1330]|uniref:hypothetical protein n=1 Tax=Rhodococcus sp. IEGM 1330 TaxID=3082225 RepID=UPI002954743B|nr:hypothetical protein [Rhodococcus sp. IEGM 1330]MDV8022211.1 hypothetical protein [Rhodococcus sp. IEGM 1330]